MHYVAEPSLNLKFTCDAPEGLGSIECQWEDYYLLSIALIQEFHVLRYQRHMCLMWRARLYAEEC